MTGGHKTVAFLSCAPHQTRLFAFVHSGLPSDMRTTLANTNFLPLMPAFWVSLFKVLFGARVPESMTDPIIALDYRKYAVNRAAFLLPFDATIKRLWRMVAATYVVLFRKRLRAQNADLLVVWGGFQLPIAAALAVAREAGIKTLFCENGYLPKTIVMDPSGINAGNSLMGKPASFYRTVDMPAASEEMFNTALVTRPLKRGGTASESITLPAQFVFLPLQVHDDSQILLYSPHFRDMRSVIRFCVAGVAAYNERFGAQMELVVKEHPSDHGRVDYSDMYRAYPAVVFTKLTSTQELIEKCAAVITVNSTVGIEAMLRLKPVVTLGDAFYAVPGLVTPCGASDDLCAVLQQTVETQVDRDLTAHFLSFLRYDYLVPLDRNDLTASDPKAAVGKILKALG